MQWEDCVRKSIPCTNKHKGVAGTELYWKVSVPVASNGKAWAVASQVPLLSRATLQTPRGLVRTPTFGEDQITLQFFGPSSRNSLWPSLQQGWKSTGFRGKHHVGKLVVFLALMPYVQGCSLPILRTRGTGRIESSGQLQPLRFLSVSPVLQGWGSSSTLEHFLKQGLFSTEACSCQVLA